MAKLTKRQWARLKSRLDAGEKASTLAREYGITRQSISGKFSEQKKVVLDVANQIVASQNDIEAALQKLPPDLQVKAWDLASDLMAISKHISIGSKYGAMTFHKLAGIANLKAQELDDNDPDHEQVALIAALTKVGNEAAAPALNLLNANKDQIKMQPIAQQNNGVSLSALEALKIKRAK